MMYIRRMHERDNKTPTEPTQRKGLYDNVGTNYLERLYENEREERNELRCPNCNRPVAKGDGDIVACLWCRKEFYDLEGMLIEVDEK
jgi:ribosomal protein L37AE/L43A